MNFLTSTYLYIEKHPHIPRDWIIPIIIIGISAFCTLLTTPLVRKYANYFKILDFPDDEDRKIHQKPVPRLGGISLFTAIFFTFLATHLTQSSSYSEASSIYALFICSMCIIVFGSLDDKFNLSPRIQLIFLIGIGFLVQYISNASIQIPLHHNQIFAPLGEFSFLLSWIATAIYIFFITKTTDTIDGIDGLATSLAIISSATILIFSTYIHHHFLMFLSASIIGSCLAFLVFNLPPAKIFLGTGGSQLLGFLLASCTLIFPIHNFQTYMYTVPLFLFGVQIFDIFNVIVRRVLSRQPIMQADKRHIHHILIQKGLSHTQTTFLLCFTSLILCLSLVGMVIYLQGRL